MYQYAKKQPPHGEKPFVGTRKGALRPELNIAASDSAVLLDTI